MESDNVRVLRYEPDDEPIESGDPFAFWNGLGTGILLSSVVWLTLIVVVLFR